MDDREIVGEARRMIERGGLTSLSMRKLAGELGVAPTAIYWHVGGREELLGRVLDAMIAEQPPIEVAGSTARERVRSIARSVRRQVRATPVLRQLAIELGRTAELAVPTQAALARELTAAGLAGDELASTTQTILYTVGGFILLDVMLGQRLAGAPRAHELWQDLDTGGLDPGFLRSMREPPDEDAVFERALDALLDALVPA
jgi:TetR/AcrR family tetracycline transcriptional repressor